MGAEKQHHPKPHWFNPGTHSGSVSLLAFFFYATRLFFAALARFATLLHSRTEASNMKIYTKTGDSGKTSLVEGTRISKAHLRIDSYGHVDELNAFLGLLAGHILNKGRYPFLKNIQDNLFVIGSNLASDPSKRATRIPPIEESDIEQLETAMDQMDAQLPELRHFVLPGGAEVVSHAHICRTVCRRAERAATRLAETDEVPEMVLKYLNRLSDYFFVLSRMLAQEAGAEEVKWIPRSKS